MEGSLQVYCVVVVVVWLDVLVKGDHEYMVTKPEVITIPSGYETTLTCEMNIDPDMFLWKFYPASDPYNPRSNISLDRFVTLKEQTRESNTKHQARKRSILTLKTVDKNDTGEYQCLAYYGASVVVSNPWRVTLASMGTFLDHRKLHAKVAPGNTITWWCEPPVSNPEAYIDYFHNHSFVKTKFKTLVIHNVTEQDSGTYKCNGTNTATSPVQTVASKASLHLQVVSNLKLSPPYFLIPPKRTYIIVKGSEVFIECSAIGNPPPKVVWYRVNNRLPANRSEMVPGGLIIRNITSSDDGAYVCNHTNRLGAISHHITLIYNEEPSVECRINNTIVDQSAELDLECDVKGVPEPQIFWFLNGFLVNDTDIQAIRNKIYFRPVQKSHAGNLQCFARNEVGTNYASISIKVNPLARSGDGSLPPPRQHHRQNGKSKGTRKPNKNNKPPKLVPPTKPNISRVNDETVAVRWSVPENNGLPILFFKVQYRELGPINGSEHSMRNKGWKTTNADIPQNIKDFDVTSLKPDHVYRFRIAAVYSNNDNKLSVKSDKFYLRRLDFDKRNPLPIPILTNTETVSDSAVKIYWKCETSLPNITVDGFYISYLSASSAGDYMKTAVDGAGTRSFVITHLQPDMVYDVKVQSFTTSSASDFSPIMKARTAVLQVSSTTGSSPISSSPSNDTSSNSQMYIIIAVCLIAAVLVVVLAIFLMFRKKWQQNKNAANRDKPVVDDHHIQAENNEYVVGPKTQPRANGCTLSNNRMTITANPLADADNKVRIRT